MTITMNPTMTHAYLVTIIRMLETVPDVVLHQFAPYCQQHLKRYIEHVNTYDTPIYIHKLPKEIQCLVWKRRRGSHYWSVHETEPKQLPHILGMYTWLGAVIRFLHDAKMLTMWHVIPERRSIYTTARSTNWIVPDMVVNLSVTSSPASDTGSLPLVDIPFGPDTTCAIGRWMVEWERGVNQNEGRIHRKWERYTRWFVMTSARHPSAPLPCVVVASPSRAWLNRTIRMWHDAWHPSFLRVCQPTVIGVHVPRGVIDPDHMPIVTHATTWPTFAAMLRDIESPLYTRRPFPTHQ